jgi:predicted  nucleic acid-binding Zn-ribbon protein
MQEVVTDITQLEEQIGRKRRKSAVHDRIMRQLRKKLEDMEHEIQQVRMKQKNLELDMQTKEGEISKLRNALQQAKSNKEYAAIISQINLMKSDDSKVQDQILEIMENIEKLQAEKKNIEDEIRQEEKQKEETKKQIEQSEQEITPQIQELYRKKEEFASTLPPDVLRQFERVASSYDGEALAPVVCEDDRLAEYSCGGCHMRVNVERVHALMQHESVEVCPNCRRILFLPEQKPSK